MSWKRLRNVTVTQFFEITRLRTTTSIEFILKQIRCTRPKDTTNCKTRQKECGICRAYTKLISPSFFGDGGGMGVNVLKNSLQKLSTQGELQLQVQPETKSTEIKSIPCLKNLVKNSKIVRIKKAWSTANTPAINQI